MTGKAKPARTFDIRAIESIIDMPIGTARDHPDVFENCTGFPAKRLGWLCHPNNVEAYMLDAYDADRIALNLGMHPSAVWPHWWDLSPEEMAA